MASIGKKNLQPFIGNDDVSILVKNSEWENKQTNILFPFPSCLLHDIANTFADIVILKVLWPKMHESFCLICVTYMVLLFSLFRFFYCDTGHPFIMSITEDPLAFGSGSVTTCFYYLGLLRLIFEHPTFRLRENV